MANKCVGMKSIYLDYTMYTIFSQSIKRKLLRTGVSSSLILVEELYQTISLKINMSPLVLLFHMLSHFELPIIKRLRVEYVYIKVEGID